MRAITINIRHRYTDCVLYSGEHETVREAVEAAVEAGADLSDADLADAKLAGADLSGAYLVGAYLAYANLVDAYLADANLVGANLSGADLTGANLTDANLAYAHLAYASLAGANLADAYLSDAKLAGAKLAGANLVDAYLGNADLAGADLADADLAGAYLSGADLTGVDLDKGDWKITREDLLAILRTARAEVPALLASLREGRVDGSTYEGDCKCLIGTIASARGVPYETIDHDPSRPAEKLFLAINRGDTPATNRISAMVVEWIEEWVAASAVVAR